MKKEVDNHLSRFLECQKLKTEHRHPTRLPQPLPIPEWKWEVVTIDFITNIAKTLKQHDSIMVVVDKLTNDAYFILVNTTHKEKEIVEIYMKEFSRLYGVPKVIFSDKDPKFTSNFWKGLFKRFGTNLNLITTYHLESDGKT
jgi:hypothetical protein